MAEQLQDIIILEDVSPVVPRHEVHSGVVVHYKHFILQANKINNYF